MMGVEVLSLAVQFATVQYIPTNASKSVNVPSMIYCAYLAAEGGTWLSFIYNTKTKGCFLNPMWATQGNAQYYHPNATVMVFNTFKTSEKAQFNPPNASVVVSNTYRDQCPVNRGYTMNKLLGMCFKIHNTRKTHARAVRICREEGGDGLLRIDNAMKQDFFVKNYDRKFTGFVDGQLVKGKWTFSNGDPMLYLPFRAGEPNGSGSCLQRALDGMTYHAQVQ